VKYLFLIIFTLLHSPCFAQDSLHVITLSEKVGEVIDSTEKKQYGLFPYYSAKDFESAQLFRMPDSSMVLRAKMKQGTLKEKVVTVDELEMMEIMLGEKSYRDKSSLKNVKGDRRSPGERQLRRGKNIMIVGGVIAVGSFIDILTFTPDPGVIIDWPVGVLFAPVGVIIVVVGLIVTANGRRKIEKENQLKIYQE
jgi:hypothetical protein